MKILIHPGWQDSNPEHWQSLWLKKYPNAIKVIQKEWHKPKKNDWVKTLNKYIEQYSDEGIIIVCHSLACATLAHWAKEKPSSTSKIKGALIVSPADVDAKDFPKEIQGFSPMPLQPLPFKNIVVTSSNDPWVKLERAKHFAKHWDSSKIINIGQHGHINTDTGFGEWPQGEQILGELT